MLADDEILTVAQVATAFGVTAQTVRSWIDVGKLRAARVGKAYNIRRRDVDQMLAAHTSPGRASAHEVWSGRASELPVSAEPPPRPAQVWDRAGTLRRRSA